MKPDDIPLQTVCLDEMLAAVKALHAILLPLPVAQRVNAYRCVGIWYNMEKK